MKQVLIVDDVEGWRKYNSDIVKELFGADAEISTAASAQEAYDILLTGKFFDIILTDLQMENTYEPKLAGEWLIEQIKRFTRYNNTAVVIISASYNARHIAEILGAGCITKSTALRCLSAYKEVLGVI